MGYWGDYTDIAVEADVRSDGSYDMFPVRCGRGWKPQTQGSRAWRNVGKHVYSLFDDNQCARWGTTNHPTMAPLISHFSNMRKDEYLKGRIIVRGQAFKPYERWAWQVRNLKYFVVLDNNGMDFWKLKLALNDNVELALQHFISQ